MTLLIHYIVRVEAMIACIQMLTGTFAMGDRMAEYAAFGVPYEQLEVAMQIPAVSTGGGHEYKEGESVKRPGKYPHTRRGY